MDPTRTLPSERLPRLPQAGEAGPSGGEAQRNQMMDEDIGPGMMRRMTCAAGGGALLGIGMKQLLTGKRMLLGPGLMALGGWLASRGCRALGGERSTSAAARMLMPVIDVRREVVIDRPPMNVYWRWRDLERLPEFMQHLEQVEVLDARRSRWTAEAPGNRSVRWEAIIIEDVPGQVIAWTSTPGSMLETHGRVQFLETVEGGTRVIVDLRYRPPAGRLGAIVARMFGEAPEQTIENDLQQLKQSMEREQITIGREAVPAVARSGASSVQGQERDRMETKLTRAQREKVVPIDRVTEGSEESFPASDPPSWMP